MYDTLNTEENVTSFYKSKWGKYFTLSKLQWKAIFHLPFISTKSTKLQWLQYRINHHILTTNVFMFKVGMKDSKMCNFCNSAEETIYHILWECPLVQDLMNLFIEFCQTRDIVIPRDPCSFILGLDLDSSCKNLYQIFLILKSYIYKKRCLHEKLSIHGLLIDIKTHLSTLKYIATKNCKLEDFLKEWEIWLFILRRL